MGLARTRRSTRRSSETDLTPHAHYVDLRGETKSSGETDDKVVQIKRSGSATTTRSRTVRVHRRYGENGGTFYDGVDIPGTNFYSSYVFTKEWLATTFGIEKRRRNVRRVKIK